MLYISFELINVFFTLLNRFAFLSPPTKKCEKVGMGRAEGDRDPSGQLNKRK
jgi:hypothetical protein